MLYIILAIVMFGILIAVHEFGHFAAAKTLGVKVNEFSIGMGPAIFKRHKGETLYALRILPIGGYCAMEGEDEETDDPRSFTKQSAWKKLIILVAGSAMNFVFGLLIVLVIYSSAAGFATPVVTGFMDGCPYESADALMAGDEFYSIDGHRIYFTTNVSTYLQRGGETHDIVVLRDGAKLKLEDMSVTPREYEGQESPMYGFYFGAKASGGLTFVKYSWYQTLDFVRQVWMALSDLIAGAVGVDQLSGPVGIVDMINQVGQTTAQEAGVAIALENIAYFAAFIAVNLAVMNMLPIPALDGGRVFFIIINSVIHAVSKKRIPAKYEGYVHATGMVLLLALMAYVMFNDIVRLVA